MTRVNTITKAAYALHRKCSKSSISKALKEGRITETEDGRIDPVAADAQWAANTRGRAGGEAAPTQAAAPAADYDLAGPAEYKVSRARREAAEAELAELELGREKMELLPVAVVRATWARVVSGAQQSLMQMAPRMAPVLASMTDPALIQAAIDEEVDRVLVDIFKASTEPMPHRAESDLEPAE